jgi:hypothetical protein
VPPAEHVPTTLTTVVDVPSPTPTMTIQDRGESTFEVEVASRREPPRRVQEDHPASRIIGDLNEHTTRSRVRNNYHFAHAAFVATIEPRDIGHALSDHDWVNSMHEELDNFERNYVTPSFKGKTECIDHVCTRIKLHTRLDIMNAKISATRIKSYYKP